MNPRATTKRATDSFRDPFCCRYEQIVCLFLGQHDDLEVVAAGEELFADELAE